MWFFQTAGTTTPVIQRHITEDPRLNMKHLAMPQAARSNSEATHCQALKDTLKQAILLKCLKSVFHLLHTSYNNLKVLVKENLLLGTMTT
jgi:hypothetical protein